LHNITKYLVLLTIIVLPQFIYSQQGSISGSDNNRLLSFGGNFDFYSKYVWRGIVLTDGAVFQPVAWISLGNLSLSLFTNINVDKGDKPSNLDEVDAQLNYGFEFGKFRLEPGVQLYLFPLEGDGPNTAEGYLKLSYHHKSLSIFTVNNIDFWNNIGSYYGEGGVGIDNKLAKYLIYSLSLKCSWSNAKFNEANYNISKQTLNLVSLSQSLTYNVNPYFSVTPVLEIQSILDPDLRATYEQSTIFNLGISITFEY
jgi:hypothetical protein